jgi:hypothetical protein
MAANKQVVGKIGQALTGKVSQAAGVYKGQNQNGTNNLSQITF